MSSTIRFFGLDLANQDFDMALADIEGRISAGEALYQASINAAKVVRMEADPAFKEEIAIADLLHADGQSVVWATRFLGQGLPERVAGIDLFQALLAIAQKYRWRVSIVGAEPAVLETAQAQIELNLPELHWGYCHHGYFAEEEQAEVISNVLESGPAMIFVAMTSPKKEAFLAALRRQHQAGLIMGVGGSVDVIAGKVQRAPRLWQRVGLEWLYRMLQEPGRLFGRYWTSNWKFIALVLKQKWKA